MRARKRKILAAKYSFYLRCFGVENHILSGGDPVLFFKKICVKKGVAWMRHRILGGAHCRPDCKFYRKGKVEIEKFSQSASTDSMQRLAFLLLYVYSITGER